jgi:hypothetical protein
MPDKQGSGSILRGIAVARKSWLFAGSDRGGERAAAMCSLIMTAKLMMSIHASGPSMSLPGSPTSPSNAWMNSCRGTGGTRKPPSPPEKVGHVIHRMLTLEGSCRWSDCPWLTVPANVATNALPLICLRHYRRPEPCWRMRPTTEMRSERSKKSETTRSPSRTQLGSNSMRSTRKPTREETSSNGRSHAARTGNVQPRARQACQELHGLRASRRFDHLVGLNESGA